MCKTLALIIAWTTIASPLGGCQFLDSCGPSSIAISGAKKFGREYWSNLFEEVEHTSCEFNCSLPSFKQLESLATRRPVISHLPKGASDVAVVLRFCFDHGIKLILRDLHTPQGKIYIAWGFSPPQYGEVLLWSRN